LLWKYNITVIKTAKNTLRTA